VLSQPIVGVLLNHDRVTSSLLVGNVLAILAAGLPGFTLFQLCVRGLQAMQHARDVFVLYVIENGLTIVLCLALGRHSMAGLTASVSLAYSLSAAVAVAALVRHGVRVLPGLLNEAVARATILSLGAGLVTAIVYAGFTFTSGIGLLVRATAAGLAGVGSFLGGTVVAQRRGNRSRNV